MSQQAEFICSALQCVREVKKNSLGPVF